MGLPRSPESAAERESPAAAPSLPGGGPVLTVDQQLHELTALLGHLQKPAEIGELQPQEEYENRLAQVRLGAAAALFAALRFKHTATAAHSVRVALGCSAWSLAMKLDDRQRDLIEVAALLHDIGKLGVPDRVLLKAGPLTLDELAIMERYRPMGLEILSACCASAELFDIVRYTPTWFNDSRIKQGLHDGQLPLGSRMIAIVDAFDSMTMDQLYRPARSRERALQELFEYAGSQFDPELIDSFHQFQQSNQQSWTGQTARRWLKQLATQVSDSFWAWQPAQDRQTCIGPASLFQQKLLDNMHDAVVFLDSKMHIVLWNRGAERLTGISSSAVHQRPFSPTLLELRDERCVAFSDADCPVAYAVAAGVQSLRRLTIRGRNRRDTEVDVHVIPVLAPDGTNFGATVLLHDASPETSLERRCQSLHEQATRDALTQLANRAEFDRVFEQFVAEHLKRRRACSIVIADIDFFKQINDTYGHLAGDEVIKSFARLLRGSCRPGDMVARYGGEEFVILYADCSSAAALDRAEDLRRSFADIRHTALGEQSVTSSFGVTEIQAGDSSETMLRRADRALLQAKEGGRNRVVQLGTGFQEVARPASRWWPWSSTPPDSLVDKHLISSVPLKITAEKLRGFVADHGAEIDKVEDDCVVLSLSGNRDSPARRTGDRVVSLIVELHCTEESPRSEAAESGQVRTHIHVVIRPRRHRDRRQSRAREFATQVLISLRSYLMAMDSPSLDDTSLSREAPRLASWFASHTPRTESVGMPR